MRKMGEMVIYVVSAIALVTGLLLLLSTPGVTHAWYSFICFTALLSAVLVKMYWPVRKSVKVWLLLAVFLSVHSLCYVVLLRNVSDWPGYSYLITCPIEVMLFAMIAKVALNVLPPNVKQKGQF